MNSPVSQQMRHKTQTEAQATDRRAARFSDRRFQLELTVAIPPRYQPSRYVMTKSNTHTHTRQSYTRRKNIHNPSPRSAGVRTGGERRGNATRAVQSSPVPGTKFFVQLHPERAYCRGREVPELPPRLLGLHLDIPLGPRTWLLRVQERSHQATTYIVHA